MIDYIENEVRKIYASSKWPRIKSSVQTLSRETADNEKARRFLVTELTRAGKDLIEFYQRSTNSTKILPPENDAEARMLYKAAYFLNSARLLGKDDRYESIIARKLNHLLPIFNEVAEKLIPQEPHNEFFTIEQKSKNALDPLSWQDSIEHSLNKGIKLRVQPI